MLDFFYPKTPSRTSRNIAESEIGLESSLDIDFRILTNSTQDLASCILV